TTPTMRATARVRALRKSWSMSNLFSWRSQVQDGGGNARTQNAGLGAGSARGFSTAAILLSRLVRDSRALDGFFSAEQVEDAPALALDFIARAWAVKHYFHFQSCLELAPRAREFVVQQGGVDAPAGRNIADG